MTASYLQQPTRLGRGWNHHHHHSKGPTPHVLTTVAGKPYCVVVIVICAHLMRPRYRTQKKSTFYPVICRRASSRSHCHIPRTYYQPRTHHQSHMLFCLEPQCLRPCPPLILFCPFFTVLLPMPRSTRRHAPPGFVSRLHVLAGRSSTDVTRQNRRSSAAPSCE